MPDPSSPQRNNLAWLKGLPLSGLHEAEHVHLSKVAACRLGSAALSSKSRSSKPRQLRRLLANEALDAQALQEPLAERLLRRAFANQARVRILVDTLELSGRRQTRKFPRSMAALAYRRRALPLCWRVRRRTGVSDANQQMSRLR